ncbi:MAG: spermidine/putrescine ABC transporter permease [Rhodobacterales bacterium RIFCSPHIGHO2_02_FULL_62_130]|jgi:spermidine/putrescine transport system permease protein|nr:MAG: spermidine/putrescine ABC transporter permease [Rhodobacterales bacterium RIFCSPHIGHO2_02_FULL_62_130]OHC55093.1 MAG: spermidine/putrescine ABC transporter permease [Rhodobacterales bacterium RIFCSPHIGHO2_12_FULL_62_75]HCZ00392.1 ABC transporter permease [Rhodobacter sp.]
MHKNRNLAFHLYMALFLAYLLIPLIIMGGAAFNDSKLPTVYPWKGYTDQWFIDLWNDNRIWIAFRNTILVAVAVAAISVPIGTAAAILINSLGGRIRSALYGIMVAPILAPGAVIGISTLLFWNKFSVPAGLHLSVLGQVSYIAAFVMLLVLARLQSFDHSLEEAALDLGATHSQVMRRIMLPHLYPAIGAGAAIAFFQSIENFNITLFTRGNADTLTVYVFSKVRSGITPTINALALLLILFTLGLAVWYELNRRRKARIEAAREAEGRRAEEAALL